MDLCLKEQSPLGLGLGIQKVIVSERKAEAILAMYRNRYPDKSPFLIQAQIATDSTARRSATLQAQRKAAQGKAPAYMCL